MNADRLLAYYEQVADAPDAVARLRRFILDLAVRGKLVPQIASDEPAWDLLVRIAKEKIGLIEGGKLRKENPLSSADNDADYDIPSTWRWTRLGLVTSYIQRGKSPKYAAADGSPVISQKCVQWRGLDLSAAKKITLESLPSYEAIRFIRKNDLLWNSTGTGTIGRIIRVGDPPEKLVCDSHVTVVRCLMVNSEYIRTWLRSDHVYARMEERAAGSTNQVELTAQMALNQVIPLPPLAEQHRIVAKVDELMGLCDRLETERADRETARERLAAASLARLNVSETAIQTAAASPVSNASRAFADDALFVLDALPALTARPDQIKNLRQTILNLAVRGKLINSKVTKLARVGRYRSLQNGYAFKSDWFSGIGVRLLRNANVGHDTIRWDEVVHLPETRVPEFERFRLREGDIVLTLDRPFITTGTKVARVGPNDLPSLLLQRVGRFIEIAPGLDNNYLFLWIISPHFNEQIDPGRSNGVPHISSKQVEAAEILVPPLAEQHRVVAKVDMLMTLCDKLEASLTIEADTRRHLLDALLAEAIAPDEERLLEAAE